MYTGKGDDEGFYWERKKERVNKCGLGLTVAVAACFCSFSLIVVYVWQMFQSKTHFGPLALSWNHHETDVFYLDEDVWSIKFKPIAEGLVAQLRSHDVSK